MTPEQEHDQRFILALLRLCKSGHSVTFSYREPNPTNKYGNEIETGLPGEADSYYMLTTREHGQDYKRIETSRHVVAEALNEGGLNELFIPKLKSKGS